MADNEDAKQTTSRGNEWEVVSLTASAYAAAPGPKAVDLKDDDKEMTYGEDEAETSHALFMSGHFNFPPKQHENLPLEADKAEIQKELEVVDVVTELNVDEGGRSTGKDKEEWDIKGLGAQDEFPGVPFFDEKGVLDASTTLHGLNLIDKEQDLYGAAKFSSFHEETTIGGSTACEENTGNSALTEPSEPGSDVSADVSHPKPTKDETIDKSNIPCEVWWKRQATALYAHAKEANAIWSIVIAAAVMGLVVFGKRWQRERWQALQLKWQFNVDSEKTRRMVSPISGLKDVIASGNGRSSFIRSSLSADQ